MNCYSDHVNFVCVSARVSVSALCARRERAVFCFCLEYVFSVYERSIFYEVYDARRIYVVDSTHTQRTAQPDHHLWSQSLITGISFVRWHSFVHIQNNYYYYFHVSNSKSTRKIVKKKIRENNNIASYLVGEKDLPLF